MLEHSVCHKVGVDTSVLDAGWLHNLKKLAWHGHSTGGQMRWTRIWR